MIHFHQAHYVMSANSLSQLPADQGAEVAFIGCSNAGKSSAMNTITKVKGLARISKTPGRTQMINFFQVSQGRRLVDLPGYGYAKVPRTIQARWHENVNRYLESRESLRGLVLVMDVRHPLKPLDQSLIHWAVSCDLSVHILLTKSDKLSKSAAKNTLLSVEATLSDYADLISVQLFSSNNGSGCEAAVAVLSQWLSAAEGEEA